MSQPSVTICIPTNGPVESATVASLVMATNFLRAAGHTMTLVFREGPYTHWNREHLVNDFLTSGDDFLVFVDTDLMFPAEAIAQLVRRNKPIIGANYHLKNDSPSGVPVTTVKFWNDDRTAFRPIASEAWPPEPLQVAAVATGLMAVRRDVLRDWPAPRFLCDFTNDDGARIGEDVWFCMEAQRRGWDVWCDPTIPVKHIGRKMY